MVPDTYTVEEFADCYWKRGYGKKRHALEWIERTGATVLTESDFERCYHEMQNEMILPHNRRYIAMRCDGSNPSAPHNQPNSSGENPLNTVRRELDATKRAEIAYKERRRDEALVKGVI